MEMLYAGAGGERIGNKTKDARENINSEGGHDGDWRFFSASLFLKFLLKPAERHLFVHATHTKYSLSIQYEPGTGQVLGHPLKNTDAHKSLFLLGTTLNVIKSAHMLSITQFISQKALCETS